MAVAAPAEFTAGATPKLEIKSKAAIIDAGEDILFGSVSQSPPPLVVLLLIHPTRLPA